MALTVTPAELTATALTLTTAAQPNITSVGTLTTLTVDDITINSSTISDAADLTFDVGGNIILNADGAYWKFEDGSTELFQINSGSQNTNLRAMVQDKDIRLQGYDGSSLITALTLDMSEAGAATFNAGATFGGSGTGAGLYLNGTNSDSIAQGNFVRYGTNFLTQSNAANSDLITYAFNGSTFVNALNIKSNGYIGIGHDDPASGLHVKGANNTAAKITMTNTASANTWSIHPAYNNQDLLFMEDSNTRVTFEEGGNVGIGTTSPSAKLNIVSTGSATYSGSSAGSNIALQLTNLESGAAGRTIGIAFSSESNAEVYLNCVTESGNNGGDFVVASRNGGSRAEKIRVHAGGDLSIANGNLVISAAGAGIDFSATANASTAGTSMGSEVLDDYEEGTWSPTIIAGTTNPTGGSNLSPEGHYVKIGRQVWVSFYIGVSWSNSPSGGVFVNRLPFTIANNGNNVAHIPVTTYNAHIGNQEVPFIAPQLGQTNARLYFMGYGGWGAADFASHVSSPLYITGQFTYFTA